MRHAFAEARDAQPFRLIAVVVLPDHLHCIWRLPEGDADNAGRWSRIKAGFSRRLPPDESRNRSRIAKRERGWQRRFWVRLILDEDDLHSHADYIRFNPVKHGHASRAADWAHSSIHAYMERGWLPADWAADARMASVGERASNVRACGGPGPPYELLPGFTHPPSWIHGLRGDCDSRDEEATMMTTNTASWNGRLWSRMRWLVWGGAACLLLLPLLAMQFTAEVDWSPFDFLVLGLMLGLACAAYEVAVRVAHSNAYVAAAGVAVTAAFLLTWINLAVGIVGSEDNPANLMFFGVLAVGLIASAASRLRPRGMSRAMTATALAQAATSAITLAIGEGHILVLTGAFVAMWLVSAALFRKAAQVSAA